MDFLLTEHIWSWQFKVFIGQLIFKFIKVGLNLLNSSDQSSSLKLEPSSVLYGQKYVNTWTSHRDWGLL